MKNEKLQIGDKVKVFDGSYSIRLDTPKEDSLDCIGLSTDVFEVTRSIPSSSLEAYAGKPVHDIFIKNRVTGREYLHSSAFVRRIGRCDHCGRSY